MLKKIVSGGQTGVDRAALDAALAQQFPCGGWCPKGRKAEDGKIDEKYPLKETTSSLYSKRTKQNIIDSDATLIITENKPDGGTALTLELSKKLKKPFFIFQFTDDPIKQTKKLTEWILANEIETLNIAGPRESKEPGIYEKSKEMIADVLL